jgi:hypothetical protein
MNGDKGQCDFCGKTRPVQYIRARDAVRTEDAEYKIRQAVESKTGRSVVGFPKLCSECFVEISKSSRLRRNPTKDDFGEE